MEDLFGHSLYYVEEDALSTVPTASSLAECEIVAVFFADNVLSACTSVADDLASLTRELNGERLRFGVAVIPQQDDVAGMQELLSRPGFFSPEEASDRTGIVRQRLGLSRILLIPEVVLIDRNTALLATDGVSALRRKALQPADFPNWRTNVLFAAASGRTGGQGIFLDFDALIRAGFYPGDLMKVSAGDSSVYLFANPPPDEDEEDALAEVETELPRAPEDRNCALLSIMARCSLSIGRDSAHRLVLEPADLTPASEVVLRVPPTSTALRDAMASIGEVAFREIFINPYFGLAGEAKADSLRDALDALGLRGDGAAGGGGSGGGGDWLPMYVAERECRHRPVRSHEKLLIPIPPEFRPEGDRRGGGEEVEWDTTRWGALEVAHVTPLGAGIVGNATRISLAVE